MLDFNGIGIKSPEDLQEALAIETDAKSFADQFMGMVDRWGLKGALSVLSVALCGSKDDVPPLIKFKKRMIPSGPPNDPWEDYRLIDIEHGEM